MVARLVRIRHDHVALTRGILPHDVPAARTAASDDAAAPDQKAPRPKHAARHARTSGPAGPEHTSLSIRSAERRRWACDLTQPGVTALVIHGLGGVGKSTLAGQIAARVSLLAPERVVTVVSGEVSGGQPGRPAGPERPGRPGQLRRQRDLRVGPADRPRPRAGGAAGPLDRQAPDHLRHGVHPAPGRPEPVRVPSPRPAYPLRGRRARDVPARAARPRRARARSGLAADRRPPACHGVSGRAAGGRPCSHALAGRVTAAVRARTGQPPAKTEPTELSEAAAEAIAQAAGQQQLASCSSGSASGPRPCSSAPPFSARRSALACWPPGRPTSPSAKPPGCLPRPRPGAVGAPLDRRRTAPPPGRGRPDRAARRRPPPGCRLLARSDRQPQLGPRAQLEAGYHLHRRRPGRPAAPPPPDRGASA